MSGEDIAKLREFEKACLLKAAYPGEGDQIGKPTMSTPLSKLIKVVDPDSETISVWMDGAGKLYQNANLSEPKVNGRYGVTLIVDANTGEVLMLHPYMPVVVTDPFSSGPPTTLDGEPLDSIQYPSVPPFIDLQEIQTVH